MTCRGGSDPKFEVEVASRVEAQPECTIRPDYSGIHHLEIVNWSCSQVQVRVRAQTQPDSLRYGDDDTWSVEATLDPRGKKRRSVVEVQRQLDHMATNYCGMHTIVITTAFGRVGGTTREEIPAMHFHINCN